MPIDLKMCMRQGWKPYQNNRFGEVLEMQFINTDNDQIMFRYAPKLDDEVKFNDNSGFKFRREDAKGD